MFANVFWFEFQCLRAPFLRPSPPAPQPARPLAHPTSHPPIRHWQPMLLGEFLTYCSIRRCFRDSDFSALQPLIHTPIVFSMPFGVMCPICLEHVDNNKDPDTKRPCGHIFHLECWRTTAKDQGQPESSALCPCCRLEPSEQDLLGQKVVRKRRALKRNLSAGSGNSKASAESEGQRLSVDQGRSSKPSTPHRIAVCSPIENESNPLGATDTSGSLWHFHIVWFVAKGVTPEGFREISRRAGLLPKGAMNFTTCRLPTQRVCELPDGFVCCPRGL